MTSFPGKPSALFFSEVNFLPSSTWFMSVGRCYFQFPVIMFGFFPTTHLQTKKAEVTNRGRESDCHNLRWLSQFMPLLGIYYIFLTISFKKNFKLFGGENTLLDRVKSSHKTLASSTENYTDIYSSIKVPWLEKMREELQGSCLTLGLLPNVSKQLQPLISLHPWWTRKHGHQSNNHTLSVPSELVLCMTHLKKWIISLVIKQTSKGANT